MSSVSSAYLMVYESATRGAASLYQMFSHFLILSIVVMIAISSAIVFVIFKYRSGRQDEPPQPVHGNLRVETSLAVFTLAIGGVLFYFTLTTMLEINRPVGDQEPDVVITGHQWWWEVEYPGKGVTTANEIHIPAGENLVVKLETADVIHSFWVPALGRKMDLVSGNTNYLQFKVDKPGTYKGACSEFCGDQHAWMRIRVIAQPKEEFREWLSRESQPAESPADSLSLRGREIFNQRACGNCHTIRGTEADGEIGPDLTHLAGRETMLAGRLNYSTGNLQRWLSDPEKIKPGAHMPRFILTDEELFALLAYLEGLE